MATAQEAVKLARAYLNDTNGISWTDAILMPLVQAAHIELIQDLDLNSIGVIKYQTAPITIPYGATDLGSDLPANIIEPISMMERTPGSSADFFVDMIKVNFLPETVQTNYLSYWAWLQQTIQLIGATTVREVILRYKGTLIAPQVLTDPLGVLFAEAFIGPRVAALCYDIAGKNSIKLNETAQTNKYKILQRGVLNDQAPVRRRGYRSPKGLRLGRCSVPIGVTTGGGAAMTWIPTTTVPNGIITAFAFPFVPKQISWNGTLQFPGSGYTVAVVGGLYMITLLDIDGNTIVPQVGDEIKEQIS